MYPEGISDEMDCPKCGQSEDPKLTWRRDHTMCIDPFKHPSGEHLDAACRRCGWAMATNVLPERAEKVS